MSLIRDRKIPIIITTLTGMFLLIDYYFNVPTINNIVIGIQNWATVIAAFALCVGGVSLYVVHMGHISKLRQTTRATQPYLSALLLIMMSITIISGFVQPMNNHPIFLWLFANIITPLSGTIYSLLAFWIASAAYRAFRARNIEATLMLLAGIIVMLRNAPIGTMIWKGFPMIGDWIYSVPVVAGYRGILIGGGLGAISLSIRTLIGIEKGHMGGD